MTGLTITHHGEARMSQRGICKTDLEIFLIHGTDIGQGRIMLKKRDAAEAIRTFKKRIANIQRLKGKVLVVEGDHLVTAYHQTVPIRTTARIKR